jgi:hypothetical protein
MPRIRPTTDTGYVLAAAGTGIALVAALPAIGSALDWVGNTAAATPAAVGSAALTVVDAARSTGNAGAVIAGLALAVIGWSVARRNPVPVLAVVAVLVPVAGWRVGARMADLPHSDPMLAAVFPVMAALAALYADGVIVLPALARALDRNDRAKTAKVKLAKTAPEES